MKSVINQGSDVFCILPWVHLFVDEYGVIFPCCIRLNDVSGITCTKGELLRGTQESFIERSWNSEQLRSLRVNMLNEEKTVYCSQCYEIDNHKMLSCRSVFNDYYKDIIADVIKGVDGEGKIPLYLRFLDIRLGNICNLACRSCFPQFSKNMVDEYRQIESQPEGYQYDLNNRWFESDYFWEEIIKKSKDLDRINFAGGEPLLVKKMFHFLRKLIEIGKSKDIVLSYNTNLTVLPSEIYELWPSFKEVHLSISIDGFNKVNDYIRYPSKWRKIKRNLEKIDRDYKKLNITNASIGLVVMVYNIFSLKELFEYTLKFKNIHPIPYITMINSKPHFEISILSGKCKDIARSRILELINLVKKYETPLFYKNRDLVKHWEISQREAVIGHLEGVLLYLDKPSDKKDISEFIRQTKIFDEFRKQNIINFIPELMNMMNGDVTP